MARDVITQFLLKGRDTASSMFRARLEEESRQAVFALCALPAGTGASGSTGGLHRLSFGQAVELCVASRDVCEATLEVVRQFGATFPDDAFVIHVSLNKSLYSSLRTLTSMHSITPFPQLHKRSALREVVVHNTLELTALMELVKTSVEELHHLQGVDDRINFKALVVFSGLNSLLLHQPRQSLDEVALCLETMSEKFNVLAVWISALNNPCPEVFARRCFSAKIPFASAFSQEHV